MSRQLRRRLFLQALEDRTAPALFTVLHLGDVGSFSLRDCVARANGNAGTDTIGFASGLTGTVTLNTGEIAISGAVNIIGPGASKLTVSGRNASRIFNTSSAPAGTAIGLSGMTLTAAKAPSFGGAIQGADEKLVVTSCIFSNNVTTAFGGAAIAMNSGGTLQATSCVFSGNTAFGAGGAIDVYGNGASVTLTRCTISGNKAGAAGGGAYISGDLLMESCTVSGNTGAGLGGGLNLSNYYDATAVFTVRNSTISGNSSKEAGGIGLYSFTTTLNVQNSTVTANSASTLGGGIRRFSGTGVIVLESSVVSGNSNAAAPDISSSGTVNQKSSAVGSASGFTKTDQGGNLPFQPHANLKLGALTNNGGTTLTHLPDPFSPLIDVGSNSAGLASDQRGIQRVTGGQADIGAVEVRTLVVKNANDSGPRSLRQAVTELNGVFGADTILFDPTDFGSAKTILLTTGEIAISEALTIIGLPGKVTIDGNAAGRIFNTSAAPAGAAIEFSGLTITNGKANGAIGIGDEAVKFDSCTIANSTSTGSGGAIRVDSSYGKLNIENCIVSGNSAAEDGGAIFMTTNATLTVRKTTISGNTAARFGGAITFFSGGKLNIDDSTLSANKANGANLFLGGGAISFSGTAATFDVINSTLSGNAATAGPGGAVSLENFSGTALIRNSTITANSAGINGGGIARTSGTGAVNFESTIIAGNTNANSPDLSFNQNSSIPGNDNLIGVADVGNFTLTGKNNLAGSKSAPIDALLGPLANNGGPTQTHALLFASPAINRGINPAGLANDQRGAGFPRQLGVAADVGALESSNTGPAAVGSDGGSGVLNFGVNAYQFSVSYADLNAIDVTTLDNNDITVTGPAFPGGVGAKFISVDNSANGSPRTATYEVAAPAGGFVAAHNGMYVVNVNVNQVQSVPGAFVTASVVGFFVVSLPKTFVVDATNDESTDSDGKTSLREALDQANAAASANTIQFSPAVFSSPQTIVLALGELKVTRSVTISGLSGNKVSVSGGNTSRVFNIGDASTSVVSVAIADLTITQGKATGDGGAIFIENEIVTLERVTVSNSTTSKQGGGIAVSTNGSLTLRDSTVSGNSAPTTGGVAVGGYGGGIYFPYNGDLTIENSTITGNSAAGQGGGVYFYGKTTSGTINVRNSTISANSAGTDGGGIVVRLFTGQLLIQNSTVAFNTANTGSGGGIFRIGSTGDIHLESSIVAKNVNVAAPDVAGSASANFSLIGNIAGATFTGNNNVFNVDPMLGSLANNGGLTQTHVLLTGSKAINAGSNTLSLPFDQRGSGFSRSVGQTDIGAFELQSSSSAKVTLVEINPGAPVPQRSRVTSLQIKFNTQVSFAGPVASAFMLTRNGGSAVGGFTATANVVAGATVVTLSDFSGAETQFGSLADGRYTLTVLASQINDFDGNGDGTPGDNFVLVGDPAVAPKLFRLFGDADGNGLIDLIDFAAFRIAFGSPSSVFSFDGSGPVDLLDFGQFRTRFGMEV